VAMPGVHVTETQQRLHAPTAAAIAGGLAVPAAFAHLGFTAEALVATFLISVLLVLAVTDLEHRVLPNRIVLPSFALLLVAQLALFPDRALEWILASLGTALVLLIPAAMQRGAVGMGDVKLGLLIGAGLGQDVIQALLFGLLAAWPVAGYLIFRDGRLAPRMALPLGPFVAFGAIVAILVD
jgi:leader peptidase (prepilin peptidase)/N-methyltransferase